MHQHNGILPSPIGPLGISYTDQTLTWIEFLPRGTACFAGTDPFWHTIIDEFQAYFQDPHYTVQLRYTMTGTPFQKRVWQALCKIPRGQTVTYGELAHTLKTSARAIGNACRRNPLPLIVPCHRIVSKQGLGGFAGAIDGELIEIKQWLLDKEMLTIL